MNFVQRKPNVNWNCDLCHLYKDTASHTLEYNQSIPTRIEY
jgi:hypothetical protein